MLNLLPSDIVVIAKSLLSFLRNVFWVKQGEISPDLVVRLPLAMVFDSKRAQKTRFSDSIIVSSDPSILEDNLAKAKYFLEMNKVASKFNSAHTGAKRIRKR